MAATVRRVILGCVLAVALLGMSTTPLAASAADWSLAQLPARNVGAAGSVEVGLEDVSCPSDSLCLAVGGFDTIASSGSPTAGASAWRVVTPAAPSGPGECSEENEAGERVSCGLTASLRSVSCPSEGLCVAVSWEGFAYVSTDPGGGPAAWSSTDLNEAAGTNVHLSSVSCPTESLCVAVSTGQNRSGPVGGKVFTTTDPASGHWQMTQLDSSLDFTAVSCGTPSLCVAVAEDGRSAVSGEPRGGASVWRVTGGPPGAAGLGAVGCAASALCVAGDDGGNLLASTEPTKVAATWKPTNGGGSVLITGVACLEESGCVAVDNNGDVLTSPDPTGGSGTWLFENLLPFHQVGLEGEQKNALFGVSCASANLCVLVGSAGRIFTSTEAFLSPSAPGGRASSAGARRRLLRPRTFFRFREMSWRGAVTRRRHAKAHFRFYSRTEVKGHECQPDRSRWRRCTSPLSYWVGHGRHTLRVRAIGPTGLRGPAAVTHFRVGRPRRGVVAHTVQP